MKKCILLIIVFILIFQTSCSVTGRAAGREENLTTNTWSANIKDHDGKIEFMEKYLVCPTKVLDAEYHIVFQDNSKGLVPGPSDWRITAMIKINPDDIAEWTKNMEEISEKQMDRTMLDELTIPDWDLSGEAAYYKRPNEQSYLVVYEKQGILLKYFFTT